MRHIRILLACFAGIAGLALAMNDNESIIPNIIGALLLLVAGRLSYKADEDNEEI